MRSFSLPTVKPVLPAAKASVIYEPPGAVDYCIIAAVARTALDAALRQPLTAANRPLASSAPSCQQTSRFNMADSRLSRR